MKIKMTVVVLGTAHAPDEDELWRGNGKPKVARRWRRQRWSGARTYGLGQVECQYLLTPWMIPTLLAGRCYSIPTKGFPESAASVALLLKNSI